MIRTFLLVAFCAPLLLVGCDTWKAGEEYAMPVYADDGQGIAAVKHGFQGKETITHLKKKDWNVQVLVKDNVDSSAPKALTGFLPGWAIEVFFMRSKGYVLLGRETDWLGSVKGGNEAYVAYEKVTMDGTITTVAAGTFPVWISCDGGQTKNGIAPHIRVIPSPDGSLFALYEKTTTCETKTQQLTFLDADSLDVVDGPFDVPDSGKQGGWQEMGWTPDGGFAIGDWAHGPDQESYWTTEFRPGEEPLFDQVVTRGCLHPSTTSSNGSSDGQMVRIDRHSGAISFESPMFGEGFTETDSPVFGMCE